jgi:hypothetical protein
VGDVLKLAEYRQKKLRQKRDRLALDRAHYLIEVLELMSRSGVQIHDVFIFEVENEGEWKTTPIDPNQLTINLDEEQS